MNLLLQNNHPILLIHEGLEWFLLRKDILLTKQNSDNPRIALKLLHNPAEEFGINTNVILESPLLRVFITCVYFVILG